MNIIPDVPTNKGSKPELGLVENEKQEYKLIGRYLRTKGLMLFSYDSQHDRLYKVDIMIQDSVVLIPDETGQQLMAKDIGVEEASINSGHIHFEALNWRTARKRLAKFKAGKLKELTNLREVNPHGIQFY